LVVPAAADAILRIFGASPERPALVFDAPHPKILGKIVLEAPEEACSQL